LHSLRFISLVRCLLIAALALVSFETLAQQVPITRYARFTGNLNFVATGGSLRSQPDTGNACAVGSSSSRALTGVPAGASIIAAYLYWGGSGSTVDATVTFNGSSITASRTFQAVYPYSPDLPFFGGFADVTNRVSGNGTYTFSGLSVNTGEPHCTPNAVQAGWGLIAIYGSASERLRAINVFDGLQYFRGSALTLTPNGFRIPSSNIDGRVAVISWEGDPGNSDPLDGFSESLRFNGSSLDDGLNPSGSSPTVQQYDGTVNSQGATNSYGADIDTYDVSSLLTPGATSATTQYSAGGDLVLLTAQVVSVTSEPSVDLSLTKTHSGNFTVGANASYTLVASSQIGSQQTDFPITVTDTLPAGLTYVAATGTSWNCGASGQLVSCTHPGPLNAGASLPPITLTVAVGNAAFPSVTNTAQVTTPSNDPDPTDNVASDVATVVGSNLSTSTKTVQDLNGGDANPGDTLRYTITLNETAGIAASAVSVSDEVPANVSGFNVVSIPAGAANSSTPPGSGANGTGRLNITGITVPANGSASVVFDVQVAAGMPPGATIVNTATISNPGGAGATPIAPAVIISASAVPGAGTKQLYLRSDMGQALYRTPPTTSQSAISVTGSETWTLTPALQTPVKLASGNMQLRLLATRIGGISNTRTISVTFANSALGVLSQVNGVTLNNVPNSNSNSPAEYLVTLNLPTQVTAPAGSTFSLTINYNSFLGLGVSIWPYSGGDTSRLELNSLSVISVESVQTFSAAYPASAAVSSFDRNSTAYVRAVVSDPFGSFDINGANVTILDPSSNTIVNNVAMTQVADSGAATRTYQYAFVVPTNAAVGNWTVRIIAREGTENAVTDLGIGAFSVVLPALSVQKASEVISDPINATTNPKRIPGSVVRYTVTVANTGQGAIDAGTLIITDALPSDVELCIAPLCGGALAFIDGSPSSGLTFNSASNVSYSSNAAGTPPFTYTPSATPMGFDSNIRGIRIAPTGAMSAATSAGAPNFSIRFYVRVK
jgi:trimeric autotransporter adhesin